METQTITWTTLSDSQKETILKQARTYLQQQIAEAKLSKSAIVSSPNTNLYKTKQV